MSAIDYSNLLKVHYQFKDKGHFMDAFTFNKCEYQLLGVLKETSKLINLEVDINVEALGEGSIWDRLNLTSKDGKQIKIQWVIALGIALFSPFGHSLEKASDWALEYLKDGPYIYSLKREKERLQLEKDIRELRQDSINNSTKEIENRIARKVSNFYATAKKLF